MPRPAGIGIRTFLGRICSDIESGRSCSSSHQYWDWWILSVSLSASLLPPSALLPGLLRTVRVLPAVPLSSSLLSQTLLPSQILSSPRLSASVLPPSLRSQILSTRPVPQRLRAHTLGERAAERAQRDRRCIGNVQAADRSIGGNARELIAALPCQSA